MMRALVIALLVLAGVCGAAQAGEAQTLIAAVRAQRPEGRYRIRLYVTPQRSDGSAAAVSLLLKGERSAQSETLDVAALAPAAWRGWQLRIVAGRGEIVRAEQVDAAGHAALTDAAQLADGVFGTDLSVDDLLGRAWAWTPAGVVGGGRVLEHDCRIVELRPPRPEAVARLRSCIAPALGLPLLSERHDAQGRVVQRYRALALARQHERWGVREFDVERPLRGSVSRVRVVGAEFEATGSDRR